MFDIEFYMRAHKMKQKIVKGESFDKEFIFNEFEKYNKESNWVEHNCKTRNKI